MPPGWSFTTVNLAQVPVFVGALLGAMLTYLFQLAGDQGCRAHRADGGQGCARPVPRKSWHYGGHVETRLRALRQHRDWRGAEGDGFPGLLAVGLPVAVGLIFRTFQRELPGSAPRCTSRDGELTVPTIAGIPVNLAGAEAVAGLLMVGTISGVLLAMLMNNGGGAWDNAKKFIETGQYGGKKSDAHKAAVVGDTVGDPFKDTAGPSLHVLIKLLATITLVLAPLFL